MGGAAYDPSNPISGGQEGRFIATFPFAISTNAPPYTQPTPTPTPSTPTPTPTPPPTPTPTPTPTSAIRVNPKSINEDSKPTTFTITLSIPAQQRANIPVTLTGPALNNTSRFQMAIDGSTTFTPLQTSFRAHVANGNTTTTFQILANPDHTTEGTNTLTATISDGTYPVGGNAHSTITVNDTSLSTLSLVNAGPTTGPGTMEANLTWDHDPLIRVPVYLIYTTTGNPVYSNNLTPQTGDFYISMNGSTTNPGLGATWFAGSNPADNGFPTQLTTVIFPTPHQGAMSITFTPANGGTNYFIGSGITWPWQNPTLPTVNITDSSGDNISSVTSNPTILKDSNSWNNVFTLTLSNAVPWNVAVKLNFGPPTDTKNLVPAITTAIRGYRTAPNPLTGPNSGQYVPGYPGNPNGYHGQDYYIVPAGQKTQTVQLFPKNDQWLTWTKSASITIVADSTYYGGLWPDYLVGPNSLANFDILDTNKPTVIVGIAPNNCIEQPEAPGVFPTGGTVALLKFSTNIGANTYGGIDYDTWTQSLAIRLSDPAAVNLPLNVSQGQDGGSNSDIELFDMNNNYLGNSVAGQTFIINPALSTSLSYHIAAAYKLHYLGTREITYQTLAGSNYTTDTTSLYPLFIWDNKPTPTTVAFNGIAVTGGNDPWTGVGTTQNVTNFTITGGLELMGDPVNPTGNAVTNLGAGSSLTQIPTTGPNTGILKIVPDLTLLNGTQLPKIVPNVLDVQISNEQENNQ